MGGWGGGEWIYDPSNPTLLNLTLELHWNNHKTDWSIRTASAVCKLCMYSLGRNKRKETFTREHTWYYFPFYCRYERPDLIHESHTDKSNSVVLRNLENVSSIFYFVSFFFSAPAERGLGQCPPAQERTDVDRTGVVLFLRLPSVRRSQRVTRKRCWFES
jgi:hypothetical protein